MFWQLAGALGLAMQTITPGEIELLMKHGHWKRARAALESLPPATPSAQRAVWRSRVLTAFGRYGEANREAEEAIRLAPQAVAGHRAQFDALGEEADQAGPLRQLTLARALKKSLERLSSAGPTHPDTLEAAALFYLAAPGVIGGDAPRGRTALEALRRIDGPRAAIAECLAEEKRCGVVLTEAAREFPEDYDAVAAWAEWLAEQKDWTTLATVGRRLVALDASRAGGHRWLALAQARLADWRGLEETIGRGEAAVPDDRLPGLEAARALLSMKAGPRLLAARWIERYLEIEPEAGSPSHDEARRLLGQARSKTK